MDGGHDSGPASLGPRLNGAARDEQGEVGLGDADVAPQLVEADAALGDQPTDEPRAGTQRKGGLLNREELLHAATVDPGRPGIRPALRPGSRPECSTKARRRLR